MEAGIAVCGPGRPFRDIARAIHEIVAGAGYVVCPAFSGHGIGRVFHQLPWVYHDGANLSCLALFAAYIAYTCALVNDEPEIMKPGQCFTIEVGGCLRRVRQRLTDVFGAAGYHQRFGF